MIRTVLASEILNHHTFRTGRNARVKTRDLTVLHNDLTRGVTPHHQGITQGPTLSLEGSILCYQDWEFFFRIHECASNAIAKIIANFLLNMLMQYTVIGKDVYNIAEKWVSVHNCIKTYGLNSSVTTRRK